MADLRSKSAIPSGVSMRRVGPHYVTSVVRPLGVGPQPSDVRFRVVPAHPELVDPFRPVSHRSPSDKIFTGRGDQAIVPQDRGPVDCRRPLREPASMGLASHSRPTVTLNLPGAGTGHLGGHQRRVSFACGVWLCCLNWVIGFLRGLPYSQRGWVF